MKKILVFTILLLNSIYLFAQNDYDVRKVKWGMTISEVINSEYPMNPEIKDDEVAFRSVDIGNTFKANLVYGFINGKLMSLEYTVCGSGPTKSTCEKTIPLIRKVNYVNYIFKALKTKGYKCSMGWYFEGKQTTLVQTTGKREDYWNANTDENTISLVNKIASEKEETRVNVGFKNNRSNVTFSFNEHQNDKYQMPSEYRVPCDHERYNIILWLRYSPNYKTEKLLKQNMF
jgi:hypothetical protein